MPLQQPSKQRFERRMNAAQKITDFTDSTPLCSPHRSVTARPRDGRPTSRHRVAVDVHSAGSSRGAVGARSIGHSGSTDTPYRWKHRQSLKYYYDDRRYSGFDLPVGHVAWWISGALSRRIDEYRVRRRSPSRGGDRSSVLAEAFRAPVAAAC